jgi:hypothetical protein
MTTVRQQISRFLERVKAPLQCTAMEDHGSPILSFPTKEGCHGDGHLIPASGYEKKSPGGVPGPGGIQITVERIENCASQGGS